MNCYECAKADQATAAVSICLHCGAALCLEHQREAAAYRVAGTTFGCPHDTDGRAHRRSSMRHGRARSPWTQGESAAASS
jgi:hypothetical protein